MAIVFVEFLKTRVIVASKENLHQWCIVSLISNSFDFGRSGGQNTIRSYKKIDRARDIAFNFNFKQSLVEWNHWSDILVMRTTESVLRYNELVVKSVKLIVSFLQNILKAVSY